MNWKYKHPDLPFDWECYAESYERAVGIFIDMWVDMTVEGVNWDEVREGAFADGTVEEIP